MAIWREGGGSEQPVRVPLGDVELEGDVGLPEGARGLVIFAHGSGSSRFSPRNRYVASVLQRSGLGTLLFDLLSAREEASDAIDAHLRFDIDFLSERLLAVTDWVVRQQFAQGLRLGYFGSSTGAAAALVAAARRPDLIGAVVSRGGRPDLAGPVLPHVKAPTLLLVGGADDTVLELNEYALSELEAPARMEVIPGATHLFSEPGALEQVAALAAEWFRDRLAGETAGTAPPAG